MQMSDRNKENWRYLIGSVGSIGLLLLGLWLRDYVDTQKEISKRIEQIYIASITQGIRDSLQNANIAKLTADFDTHERATSAAIMQIQQSLLSAQQQIVESDKLNNSNNN